MTGVLEGVKVTITAFVENYPPGIVGCEFADVNGCVRKFEIKFYDVSGHDLDDGSVYPAPGVLGCDVIARSQSESGRDVLEIETDWPSLENQDRFHIFADQLTTAVTECFRSRRSLKPVPAGLTTVVVSATRKARGPMDYKSVIRTIPDFPKKGIMFRDITTLFGDAEAFRGAIDELVTHYKGVRIDKVAGIEARGFILGGAMAHQLSTGFVPIRKKGKLPFSVLGEDYDLEYGKDRIEIHTDAVKPGDNVIIVDDLIATGGTCFAAIKLLQRAGAKVVGCCFVIDLPELGGSGKIRAFGQDVKALVTFEGH